MNAAEWNDCSTPTSLLEALPPGRLEKRLLRLWACACCKRIYSLLGRNAVRNAVGVAEEFAIGRATADDLHAGKMEIRRALQNAPLGTKWEEALMVALHATSEAMTVYTANQAADAAARAADHVWRDANPAARGREDEMRRHLGLPLERAYQCDALRDLFPFEPPDPAACARLPRSADVRTLAEAIWAEERFTDLPVLADALEDAGCDDLAVLAHCRARGRVHVRGCWVVEMILRGPGRPAALT